MGNNRGNLHANAHRGSGGVGVFLKHALFDFYDITTLEKSVEDKLWIKVKCIKSDYILCIAICYLPPNESSRPNDQAMFFENLLQQVYCNQTIGNIVICGDFNSR
jgi:exonuclease III